MKRCFNRVSKRILPTADILHSYSTSSFSYPVPSQYNHQDESLITSLTTHHHRFESQHCLQVVTISQQRQHPHNASEINFFFISHMAVLFELLIETCNSSSALRRWTSTGILHPVSAFSQHLNARLYPSLSLSRRIIAPPARVTNQVV
jgi:hypothetical protein